MPSNIAEDKGQLPFNVQFAPAPAPAQKATFRRVPPSQQQQAPSASQRAPAAKAPFPPLPPPAAAGPQTLKLKQKKEKFELWNRLIIQKSFNDGRMISKEDGKEVFNLIYWFLCHYGCDCNAKWLFQTVGAQQFEKFLNYLQNGAVTDLFSEYVHNYLEDRDLQYSQFISDVVNKKNEEQKTSHSKLYFLGFGKRTKISRKLYHVIKKKFESEEGENLAPNTNNHHSARSTTSLHTTQSTSEILRHALDPRTLQDEAAATATGDEAMAVDTPEAKAEANEHYIAGAPVFGKTPFIDSSSEAAPAPPPAPFVAAAATTRSASEGVVPPKGVPPPSPFVAAPTPATPVPLTPKSELQPSTRSRSLQLDRTQLFNTASRAHHYSTPSRSTTNQTPFKTPLPSANLHEVHTHLMTASRGDSIIEKMLLMDAESAESLASFGKNSDKLDAQSLMGLRSSFHPLLLQLSNQREFSRLIENMESNPMYAVSVANQLNGVKDHTGTKSFIAALESQKKTVDDEKDEVLERNAQINQIKNFASEKTFELVEQSEHNTKEEVQKLMNQNEELDRKRKEKNEELDRKRKEMNEELDRKRKEMNEKLDREKVEVNEEFDHEKEENVRKMEELRGACKKKKEAFLHNEKLDTVKADKVEKTLAERYTSVQEANAYRLAIPLAQRKCDEMAMELLHKALKLQDISFGATDDDRKKFQEEKDVFFRYLTLVEERNDVLIGEAFQDLYG